MAISYTLEITTQSGSGKTDQRREDRDCYLLVLRREE